MIRIDPATLDEPSVHNLLKGCVVPRPIAWVTTLGPHGIVNAAPFSCYTFLATRPPLLGLAIEPKPSGKKDTLVNLERTGDFVVNAAVEEHAAAINASAAPYPPEVSELARAGLTAVASDRVQAPRIAESPLALECRVERILELGRSRHSLVIGEVVLVHVRPDLWRAGAVDVAALKPLARLSGDSYGCIRDMFELARPWTTPGHEPLH